MVIGSQPHFVVVLGGGSLKKFVGNFFVFVFFGRMEKYFTEPRKKFKRPILYIKIPKTLRLCEKYKLVRVNKIMRPIMKKNQGWI